MGTEVAHRTPGRVRLCSDDLSESPELAEALRRRLDLTSGLGPVRVSAHSASVIVHHEPTWTSAEIAAEIDQFWSDPPAVNVVSKSQNPDLRRQTTELVAATGALALSAFDGAVPLTLALLGLGSRSIVSRTRTSLFEDRRLTVDALDTAAIALLAAQGMFPYAAFITTLVTTAEMIRGTTREKSRQAIADVMGHLAMTTWVERDGAVIEVDADDVRLEEVVVVTAGDRIPVDGVVVEGKVIVDQQALTGESVPVERDFGDEVFAATAVVEGRARIAAQSVGSDTRVAQIVTMIADAPTDDTRVQNYAAQWANRLVPFSFLAGGIALVTGGVARAATVLVIDYGAGFRVSAPTAIMSSMTKAAREGILIRGGSHLEKLAEIDAVVLDKTGTLTLGSPTVATTKPFNGATPVEVLALAAAAEQRLNHPVAEAVVAAAGHAGLTLPERTDWEYTIGQGVDALIDGDVVVVGSQRFLRSRGIETPDSWRDELARIEQCAMSPLCVARNGEPFGAMGLADPVRPESAAVIRALRNRGIRHIALVTGDRQMVANAVANRIGVDIVVAEAFPETKLEIVADLQARGFRVGAVGDGINDAPALAHADVGIAVNGGTAAAQEAADVLLLRGDLQKLPEAIDIARDGLRLVRQNWQLIRIPNSFGLGLAFFGAVGPAGASLISDGAAIAAGLNSLRPLAGRHRERRLQHD